MPITRKKMPLRALLVASLLLLLLPVSALGATRHVVRGAGYGHGVGMSQYGAYGFARQGSGYRSILAHYYRGTELGQADTRTIRVLLRANASALSFEGASAVGGRRLDVDRRYTVVLRGGQLELRSGSRRLGRFGGPLTATGPDGGLRLLGRALNGIDGGAYRGALELRPSSDGGLTAVNAASLDAYVQGVVPGEVPSSWPFEALRAQAVAARSYALATDRGGEVFDQYPDVRSQVYRGITGEQASTNRAVADTAGEVLRYGGSIATTFFFSTSGGRTENVENVFRGSGPKPYLVSVEDPFDGASPRHRWSFSFTQRQMQGKLGGLVKGRFRRVKVTRRGASPRIVDAVVVGSRGSTPVAGPVLRTRLGLPDTWAYFARVSTRRSRAARLARVVGRRRLVAEVSPPPRRGPVVQRRERGRWVAAGRLRASADGRFTFGLRRPGRYRVVVGGFAGPSVRVR